MKTACISGITGQDGSYLAELLLEQDYRVVGMMRRCSHNNTENIDHLIGRIELEEGDMTDILSIIRILKAHQPTRIFNAAAQSFVKDSFNEPFHTMEVTGIGVMNMLEAMRMVCNDYDCRMLQFSTSELFGDSFDPITLNQGENTPMNPQSPYAIAKMVGYNSVRLYRKAYGMFASNMIAFNHESARRKVEFVTRKITSYVAGLYDHMKRCGAVRQYPKLFLGNITACRDWGYAPDYMRAAIKILDHNKPDDFVIATGETHTIEEFLEVAFGIIGADYKNYVAICDSYMRPAEVQFLRGNATKAHLELDWSPNVTFKELVEIMVKSDILGEGYGADEQI